MTEQKTSTATTPEGPTKTGSETSVPTLPPMTVAGSSYSAAASVVTSKEAAAAETKVALSEQPTTKLLQAAITTLETIQRSIIPARNFEFEQQRTELYQQRIAITKEYISVVMKEYLATQKEQELKNIPNIPLLTHLLLTSFQVGESNNLCTYANLLLLSHYNETNNAVVTVSHKRTKQTHSYLVIGVGKEHTITQETLKDDAVALEDIPFAFGPETITLDPSLNLMFYNDALLDNELQRSQFEHAMFEFNELIAITYWSHNLKQEDARNLESLVTALHANLVNKMQQDFIQAVQNNDEAKALKLLQTELIEPSNPIFLKDPLLHLAVQFKQRKLLKFLLETGVDVNLLNSQNQTALDLAVIGDDLEAVRLLMKAGAGTSESRKKMAADCSNSKIKQLLTAEVKPEASTPTFEHLQLKNKNTDITSELAIAENLLIQAKNLPQTEAKALNEQARQLYSNLLPRLSGIKNKEQRDKLNADIQFGLGLYYLNNQDSTQAIAHFKKSLASHNSAKAHIQLGLIYNTSENADYRAALLEFSHSLEIMSDFVGSNLSLYQVFLDRAKSYAGLEIYSEATKDFFFVVENTPQKIAKAKDKLAELCESQSAASTNKIYKLYQEMDRLCTAYEEANLGIAQCCEKSGLWKYVTKSYQAAMLYASKKNAAKYEQRKQHAEEMLHEQETVLTKELEEREQKKTAREQAKIQKKSKHAKSEGSASYSSIQQSLVAAAPDQQTLARLERDLKEAKQKHDTLLRTHGTEISDRTRSSLENTFAKLLTKKSKAALSVQGITSLLAEIDKFVSRTAAIDIEHKLTPEPQPKAAETKLLPKEATAVQETAVTTDALGFQTTCYPLLNFPAYACIHPNTFTSTIDPIVQTKFEILLKRFPSMVRSDNQQGIKRLKKDQPSEPDVFTLKLVGALGDLRLLGRMEKVMLEGKEASVIVFSKLVENFHGNEKREIPKFINETNAEQLKASQKKSQK